MPPDHAELLGGEVDGDLLDVAVRTDDHMHEPSLNGAWREGGGGIDGECFFYVHLYT